MHNPRTIYAVNQRERKRIKTEQIAKEKKESVEKKRLEDERVAKAREARGETDNPFIEFGKELKSFGKEILNWFNNCYKNDPK